MKRLLTILAASFWMGVVAAHAQSVPIYNPILSGIIKYPGYVNQMFVTDSNGVIHPLILGANLSYNPSTFTLTATGGGGGGGGTWGSITGTLSNQTDLWDQLLLLAPLANPTFTGTANFTNIDVSGTIATGTLTATGAVNYQLGITEPIPTSGLPIQGRVLTGYLAGANLTKGQLVGMNTSAQWVAADDTTGVVARGLCTANVSSGSAAAILIHGSFYWTGYSGLTVGSLVWLGPTGTIVGSAPTGSGDIVQTIGFCTGSDTVVYTFSGEYLTHQ